MFVIAIILVVTSPKCPPKPERQWWQKQLCYQVYTRSFKDGNGDGVGDFKGLKEKLPGLSRSHVQTVWPVPVLESTSFSGYDVVNFTNVDQRLGTLDEFEDFVKAAHELKIYVVIDLPLVVSKESQWYKDSRKRSDGPDSQLFIWSSRNDPSTSDYDFDTTRNENVMVRKDGSGASMPILNWNSTEVRRRMKSVMEFWVNKGVDGFYLGYVQYLTISTNGVPNSERLAESVRALRQDVDAISNATGKQIAIFTTLSHALTDAGNDDAVLDRLKVQLVGEDGLHYVLNKELTDVDDKCDAPCIRNHVIRAHDFFLQNNDTWPVWEIGSPYQSRVASRLGKNRDRAELLQMLLFMLEGSVNTYYGDELGIFDADEASIINISNPKNFVMRSPMQWDDSKNAGFSINDTINIPPNPDYAENNLKTVLEKPASQAKLFRKMGEWRVNDEAFLYGNMDVQAEHPSIVAVRRNSYAASPNYYAVMNFANETFTEFDLTHAFNLTLPSSSGEPTVGIMTSNLAMTKKYRNRDTIDIKKVHLEPYSGLVIKYK
jgi:glycosidase